MTYDALVVGCGSMGSKLDEGQKGEVALTHSTGYEMHEKTSLVGGVDPDPNRLQGFESARDVPGYTDVGEAFDELSVDIVSICTPLEERQDAVNQAITADVDGILCEKPIAEDTTVARDIVDRCQSNGVTLAVNYIRRYLPGFQVARSMIRNGALGQCRRVILVYTKDLINNGSHMVDTARWWFGEPVEIHASRGTKPDAIATFGGTSVHLVYAGNSEYSHVSFELYGDRGRLRMTDQGRRLVWQTMQESELFEGFKSLGGLKEIPTGFEWMCYFVVDDFVDSVEFGFSPACDGEAAFRTLSICERFL